MGGHTEGERARTRSAAPGHTHRGPTRGRRLGRLVGVTAVAAALVVGVAALILDRGGRSSAHDGSPSPARSASASASALASSSAQRSGAHPAPSDPGPSDPGPADPGSSHAARSGTVTCWTGRTAARGTCPTPTGRAGLTSVFPALDGACPAGGRQRAGRTEVSVCAGAGYHVRYARWQDGYDRFAVFDRSYDGPGARWRVRGRFAGRVWTCDEASPTGPEHGGFRWAATYRDRPLSVEVIADDEAVRASVVATLHVAAAAHIGR